MVQLDLFSHTIANLFIDKKKFFATIDLWSE